MFFGEDTFVMVVSTDIHTEEFYFDAERKKNYQETQIRYNFLHFEFSGLV